MRTKILGLLALGLLAGPMASAATISVNTDLDNTANDGLCSLREAVSNANLNLGTLECAAGAGNDLIVFTGPFSIYLQSTLQILQNLTIAGPVTIFGPNGIGLNDAFVVDQGVTLTLLRVTDGNTVSVPEPSTLALLGLGLAGLGLSRRRRAN